MKTALVAFVILGFCIACDRATNVQVGSGPASVTDVFSYPAAACEGLGFAFSHDAQKFLPRPDVLRAVQSRIVLDVTVKPEGSDSFPGFQAVLFCPVPSANPNPPWNRFVLNYRDPVDQIADGTGLPVIPRVVAELKFLDESGNETTIATLKSNNFQGTQFASRAVELQHTFDFAHRFYFVHIVFRTDGGRPSPEVGGIRLERNPGNVIVQ